MFTAEQGKNNNLLRELHTLLRANFTCEQWQKFDEQKIDRLRVKTLLESKKSEIETWINKKTDLQAPAKVKTKALALKNAGNKAFGAGNNQSALKCYSESVLCMPQDDSPDAAIVYANRSACLFHLKEYSLALQDAEIAFKLNYPVELHHKLYERVGRCNMHLGKMEEATNMIKLAIQAIGNSSALEGNKAAKMKSDLKILLSTIPTTFSHEVRNDFEETAALPEVIGGPGQYLQNATQRCELRRNDAEGRFISATEDIFPGDAVFVEKAYVSSLSSEFCHKHCFHCFEQLRVPVACSSCDVVSYCSPNCKDSAWSSHHRYECPILPFFKKSKISVICYLAVRILTQKNPLEALSWYPLANSTEECNNNSNEVQNLDCLNELNSKSHNDAFYKSDHITALLNHVTHSKERNTQENFQQTIIALYLLFVLKKTDYFREIMEKTLTETNEENGKKEADARNAEEFVELQLGTLILRFLNFLQFNTHEISTWDSKKKESVYIGAGLFNTLTLSNHACVPTLTRYFIKDTVVVKAIRTIRKGEQVTDNYGPFFATSTTEERKLTLLNAFWFDCQCSACRNYWPIFEEMSEEYNFKCGFCHRGLFFSNDEAVSFAVRCPNCTQMTNTIAVIKSLQGLETKYKQASDLMTEGQVDTVLKMSLEAISQLDDLIVLPCRLYQIWQDTAKTCFQKLGNKSVDLTIYND